MLLLRKAKKVLVNPRVRTMTNRRLQIALIGIALSLSAPAMAQTYRATWDLTDDFEIGWIEKTNVNATDVRDQLQLELSGIETPYLWISNTGSNEVAQMSSVDGTIIRVVELEHPGDGPSALDPSRTAVDVDFNCWVGYRRGDAVGRLDAEGVADQFFPNSAYTIGGADCSNPSYNEDEDPQGCAWDYIRAVAINADGNVWVGNWFDKQLRLLDPDTGGLLNLTARPVRPYNPGLGDVEDDTDMPVVGGGSAYGFSMDAFNNLWVAQRGDWVGQYNATTGEHIMTYSFEHRFSVDFYGIAVDIDGNVWVGNGDADNLVYLPREEIEYCMENEVDGNCAVRTQPGDGDPTEYAQLIRPPAELDTDGDGDCEMTRGVAVDQSGNVWVNCYGEKTTHWTCNSNDGDNSVMHVDGATLDVLGVYPVGVGPLGITATADGTVWTVNACGGAPDRPRGESGWVDYTQRYDCPNGSQQACNDSTPCSSGDEVCVGADGPVAGQCRFRPWVGGAGSVTRMRGSDGRVIATYPTCGLSPYTYSDLAGYNLRSVALRSGWWKGIHDSSQSGLSWRQLDWNASMPQDTIIRYTIGASDTEADLLEELPHEVVIDVNAGTICLDDIEPCTSSADPARDGIDLTSLGLAGRYLGLRTFLLTQNDFLGPVIEDITVSSQCVPTDEICNGFDDNCDEDGLIDEDIAPRGTCETGLPGACNDGHYICSAGREVCVRAEEPTDEVCNEIDDDCDGRVDEGVTNACLTCGEPPEEICNGEDDNCNGLTDEAVQRTCLDYTTCTTFTTCEACPDRPVEICNGEDDNCNGLVDEGEARVCTDYREDNRCGTLQVCDDFCPDPPGEICNGEDDNCNGLVDEGAVNVCINFSDCTIFQTCDDCEPTPREDCDGIDNDCDGEVDEDTTNRCGTCGDEPLEVCDGIDNDCDGEVDEGTTNVCGFCGDVPLEVCDGIDNDCDGDVDEGVANRCGGCGPEPAEVCNGLDDDCDGDVDDGVANACGGCGPLPLEVCDGEDNDCNGETDEDTDELCESELSGSVCVTEAGECARPCSANECPTGRVCWNDFCITDPCVEVSCAMGFVCMDGECENLCDLNNIVCEDELVCVGGRCVANVCSNTGCDTGAICVANECVPDPCAEVSCAIGEVCASGDCIDDPCTSTLCEDGERCDLGVCVDACEGVNCGVNEVCVEGFCVINSCAGVTCPAGADCVDGNCVQSECVDVLCGEGAICRDGACVTTRVGGPCGSGLSVCGEELICYESICRELTDPLVADLVDDDDDDDTPGTTTPPPEEGCSCNSGGWPSTASFWLVLFLGFFASRRRARRTGADLSA